MRKIDDRYFLHFTTFNSGVFSGKRHNEMAFVICIFLYMPDYLSVLMLKEDIRYIYMRSKKC